MNGTWFFFACSSAVGFMGMIGLRKEKTCCLVLSALALPVLVFTALWNHIGFADISSGFCIIAFLVLCGLRGSGK